MADLVITDLSGNSELITDVKNIMIRQRVNGEYSLSFLLFKTERNSHAFDLVAEESIVEYEDYSYRIKKINEKTIGNTVVKEVQAAHTFFDLIDTYQYESLTGSLTLDQCLNHALAGTGWTHTVIGSFGVEPFEHFGDDNTLTLIQKACEQFGVEYEPGNNIITIKAQIGAITDYQMRYKHNVKTLSKHIDTSSLSTYIKGYGKKNDDGTQVTAEYTSPASSTFGIRHAKAFRDERYTSTESLLDRIQKEINDQPSITFEMEFIDLQKAGYAADTIALGDSIWLIYEPLGIDLQVRVIDLESYPDSPQSPKVTLTTEKKMIKKDILDVIVESQKTTEFVDKVSTEKGVSSVWLDGVIDTLQNQVKAVRSNTTAAVLEGQGILLEINGGTDQGALYLGPGIFAIADSKDGQGDWNFRTFGTGKGFTADEINAGTLNANLVQIMSTLSGAAQITIDETGLKAYDTEGKITFHIDSNGDATFSGKVKGGSIETDTTITVTTDAYIGNNLYLGDRYAYGTAKSLYFNDMANITGGDGFAGGDMTINADVLKFRGSEVDFGYRPLTGIGDIYASRVYAGSLKYDDANYFAVNPSGAKVFVNGTLKASWASIPKIRLDVDQDANGDVIVNERSFGANNPASMQPLLIDYITKSLNGQDTIYLDKNFLSFIGSYNVFTTGDVVITEKNTSSFTVNGNGDVAFMVVGIEKGKEDTCGYAIEEEEVSVTEMINGEAVEIMETQKVFKSKNRTIS